MATVHLAKDVKHRRQVAVKVLHPHLAAHAGTERFLREIEIAAGLSHPHILTLIAVENGFGHREWIEQDGDLDTLRSLPRFQQLLKRL